MTEIANIYLGNSQENTDLAQQLIGTEYLEVYLQPSDRSKGRIYTQTNSGVTVGIIKSRAQTLQSGDIFQTESGNLLLIHLQAQELLVLDFVEVTSEIAPTTLVYLGHLLGNHHYPIAIQDNKIYVQLVTDKSIIEKTINNLNIPGLKIAITKRSLDTEISFSVHNH